MTEEKDPAKNTAEEQEQKEEGGGGDEKKVVEEETAETTKGDAPEEPELDEEGKRRQAEMEALVVAQAAASADAAYVPTPSLLESESAEPLLSQVDGPSLADRIVVDSVYAARQVPIPFRKSLEVPIHVTTAGSVVEYTVESQDYDVGFGIRAEREESTTVVIETDRVDSHLEPITGKFLVGSVPCVLIFTFDNEYSWFREKLLTYKIIVKPPTLKTIKSGRRSRAQAALKSVTDDLVDAKSKFGTVETQRKSLALEVAELRASLEERSKALEIAETEESRLKKRLEVRKSQESMLNERLDKGWEDEKFVEEVDTNGLAEL